MYRRNAARRSKKFLSPANIHRRKPRIAPREDVIGLEDEGGTKSANDAAGEHLKRAGSGEPWLHGDSLRIAQPLFEIERTVVPASQMKRENLPAGEGINAQDAEVFARSVGKSHHTFHDGRGGFDSRDRGYGGQQGIVEAAANFKVGSARCQLRSQAKARYGSAVGNLNREKYSDTKRYAEDVETG